jgi:tRNA nucleotidyltransferase (CCA-adding enzyme)
MARTAASVTPEEMEVYRTALRQREAALQAQLAGRKADAWNVARSVATMLRERHGATEVVLFGSLARDTFAFDSDIDLLVYGLDDAGWDDATLDADALAGDQVVEMLSSQYATGRLALEIERDGVVLT